VEFCHQLGLDYVSCSPYRLPIARMAAAQAVLHERAAAGAPRRAAGRPAPKPNPVATTRRGGRGAGRPAGKGGRG
jgi:pyruvate,orthophosphate dikinase